MSHDKYRVYNGRYGTDQFDIPPFEAFRTDLEARERVCDGVFTSAMTIRQVVEVTDAVRFLGMDPNVEGVGSVRVVSDHSVIPVIDGTPHHQGAPDVNPDWRVPVRVDAGETPATLFDALDYLDARSTQSI